MKHYEKMKNPFTNKPYWDDDYKSAIQLDVNADGSFDTYDYNTEEHLNHYK